MRMRARIAGMMTAVCLSAAALSAAQDTGAQGTPRARANRPPLGAVAPAELANMLDTYAIVQAQDALKLDDAKYGQFVTRLKRLQETRRRSQRERNQIVQELRKLAGPQATGPVDEAAVRDRLKALRDHDERAAATVRQAYDSLDEVLDVAQQARFRIFEERMEQRKLDLLVRARERAARLNRQSER
jgi:hypothetical protein